MFLGAEPTPARFFHLVTMQSDAADLFDCLPTLVRSQTQHLVHEPLTHEREAAGSQAAVAEQILDIAQAGDSAIDSNLRLAVAVNATNDLDLGRVEIEPAVAIVELDAHLGESARGAVSATGENDVLGPLGSQGATGSCANRPAQRVHHIRLAGAVGTDDGGYGLFELQGRSGGEGLVAMQVDRPESRHTACSSSVANARRAASISAACLLRPAPSANVRPSSSTMARNDRSCGGPVCSTIE